MVFTVGKKKSIEGILNVFKYFTKFLGLDISLEKSTLFMAGVADTIKKNILEQFPFDTCVLPMRYLGLPLLTRRMRVKDYSPLLEKILR